MRPLWILFLPCGRTADRKHSRGRPLSRGNNGSAACLQCDAAQQGCAAHNQRQRWRTRACARARRDWFSSGVQLRGRSRHGLFQSARGRRGPKLRLLRAVFGTAPFLRQAHGRDLLAAKGDRGCSCQRAQGHLRGCARHLHPQGPEPLSAYCAQRHGLWRRRQDGALSQGARQAGTPWLLCGGTQAPPAGESWADSACDLADRGCHPRLFAQRPGPWPWPAHKTLSCARAGRRCRRRDSSCSGGSREESGQPGGCDHPRRRFGGGSFLLQRRSPRKGHFRVSCACSDWHRPRSGHEPCGLHRRRECVYAHQGSPDAAHA